MGYLGNAPARSFISFERQVFTIVNSQTAYTLSHSVTNENDIRLVINNVVQEPGSGKAYTASGTTLTLSAALTNGTDEMYCVFLGRAVGTVNAPAGSVGTSQLVDLNVTTAKLAENAVTLAKMASGTDGQIITYDASGNPVAVGPGTDGQVLTSTGAGSPPAFEAIPSSDPYTAQSNAESGYIKLVGGVIIQWGLFGTFGIASTGTVTFPTTFVSNCWTVVNGLWVNNTNAYNALTISRSPSTSQFTWYQGDTGNTGRVGAYIAIGK